MQNQHSILRGTITIVYPPYLLHEGTVVACTQTANLTTNMRMRDVYGARELENLHAYTSLCPAY